MDERILLTYFNIVHKAYVHLCRKQKFLNSPEYCFVNAFDKSVFEAYDKA